MLQAPLKELSHGTEDGGEVAKSLSDLRIEVEKLDPSGLDTDAGWFTRFVGKIPGVGTPLKRYFMRYESSQTQIDSIVQSLEKGRDQLKRDNTTLGDDQKQMRELHPRAHRSGRARAGARRRRRRQAGDRDRPRRPAPPVRRGGHPVRAPPAHARPAAAARGQPAGRPGDRDHHPQQPRTDPRCRSGARRDHQRAAGRGDRGAGARAPEDRARQDRGDQHDHVGDDRRHRRTAEDAGHRRSIEQASSTMLDMESLKQAFADIDTALDEISRYRREALPTMAGTILELDQLTAESEAAIQKMESGRAATTKLEGSGTDRHRRDHRRHPQPGRPNDPRDRDARRLAIVVADVALVAVGRGSVRLERERRAARPGRGVRTARRAGRRDRLGRRTRHPQRVDPATDRRQPRRHPAADRRVPDHGGGAGERRRGRRGLVVDREVGRGHRRLDARGRRGLQRRRASRSSDGSVAGRRPALHRVGHRLPVHRPRRRPARRVSRRRASCGSRWRASSRR